MTTHYPYLIEQVCSGQVPELLSPQKKYALLIRSGSAIGGPSLSSTILNLVNYHDYHNIEIIEPCGSPGFDGSGFAQRVAYLPRLCERVRELASDIGEDSILQISYFGPLVRDGSNFIIPSSDGDIRGSDLLSSLASVASRSNVHYIGSSSQYAGNFARLIAETQHPDLGARHIAISPSIPDAVNERDYFQRTFHDQFFGNSHHRSIDTRFRASARKQAEAAVSRGSLPSHAYLAYGHVSPRHASL